MVRSQAVVRLLVASPSDLETERDLVEVTVRELNLVWPDFAGVRLAPLRWEKDGVPGAGPDPQTILNNEFGEDIDILVGMMWERFGTPTTTAPSGTVEEFRRAHDRFKQDPSSVDILFYFKQLSKKSKDRSDQLHLVEAFKHELIEKGVLFWEFTNTRDLAPLLRVHLAKKIIDRIGGLGMLSRPPEAEMKSLVSENPFDAASAIVVNVASALSDFGTAMSVQAQRLHDARDRRESLIVSCLNHVGSAADSLAETIRDDLPRLTAEIDRGFENLSDLILAVPNAPAARPHLGVLELALVLMHERSGSVILSIGELRDRLLGYQDEAPSFHQSTYEAQKPDGAVPQ